MSSTVTTFAIKSRLAAAPPPRPSLSVSVDLVMLYSPAKAQRGCVIIDDGMDAQTIVSTASNVF